MGKTIVIVGSGVAGALIAKGLLNNYPDIERVTMLEAGDEVPLANQRMWQDYVTADRLPYEKNRDICSEFDSAPEKIGLIESRLIVKGGSTVHWGGWALRFKPEDFRLFSEAKREIDWPFGYEEISPYYHSAEMALGIAGDSTNNDPPRAGKEYPYTAPPYCLPDGLVINALSAKSYSYAHLPIARFGDRCITTGTCKYCPVGGRYAAPMTLQDIEQKFGPSGRFILRLNCAVRRVMMENVKSAAGVEYFEKGSSLSKKESADVVILCAGAIETPKILLQSVSYQWPKGLGNATDNVGKHFKTHPMLFVDARFPDNAAQMHQEIDFPTLCSRHFDTPQYQRDGKMFFVRAVSSPNAKLESLMRAGKDIKALEAASKGQMKLTLNGFIEQFSSPRNSVELGSGNTRFGLPKTKINYTQLVDQQAAAYKHIERLKDILVAAGGEPVNSGIREPRADHTTSTTRFSNSAADGVVDPQLRVHGTDNVFICSNSVMPNVSAVNPTLTLAALALRFVDKAHELLSIKKALVPVVGSNANAQRTPGKTRDSS
jgi:choline dehydrogenase-like flavoprotein